MELDDVVEIRMCFIFIIYRLKRIHLIQIDYKFELNDRVNKCYESLIKY